jgi:SAM-dependent methyltransferase
MSFAVPLPESMSVPHTWNLVAPGYAAEIVPAFTRFAEDALELAQLVPGELMLDVATGPGTVALAAARAGARVSAIDFSPQMIAELGARLGREGVANVEARVADATALPFDQDAFDAVLSMFALNLMADRAAAFREIYRVLRPGGRAVIGTPASLTRTAAFADIRDIIHRSLPDLEVDIELPLAEPAELRTELSAAGFDSVDVRTVTRSLQFPSVAAIWTTASRAAAPVVLAREAMAAERWSRASGEVVRALEQRFGPGPQEIEVTVNLARATK